MKSTASSFALQTGRRSFVRFPLRQLRKASGFSLRQSICRPLLLGTIDVPIEGADVTTQGSPPRYFYIFSQFRSSLGTLLACLGLLLVSLPSPLGPGSATVVHGCSTKISWFYNGCMYTGRTRQPACVLFRVRYSDSTDFFRLVFFSVSVSSLVLLSKS